MLQDSKAAKKEMTTKDFGNMAQGETKVVKEIPFMLLSCTTWLFFSICFHFPPILPFPLLFPI